MSDYTSPRISSLDVATVADEYIVELATRLGAMSEKLLALHNEIGIATLDGQYDNQAIKRARGVAGVMVDGAGDISKGLTALNEYLDAHPHVF
jgi:hypothetical protein